ncbi:MAG: metallophosphoesterase family protein [Thermomicrobiales bacterium]|nr:metallophosphoesterase family protein [Thermomicrobiales bacterium]
MDRHRSAVFGDIHGNVAAIQAVLGDIGLYCPDTLICLGDLVGYAAHPNETIEVVRSLDIPVVMGNYDYGIGFERDDCGCAYKDKTEKANGELSVAWTSAAVTSENKKWLRTLRKEYRLEVSEVRIRFVHGSPRRINEYLFEDRDPASLARIARVADCDVLVFGHTHKPWSQKIGDVLFVNAGSVGKPKDGDSRACWVSIEIAADHSVTVDFHRVKYDLSSETTAIRAEAGLPDIYATDIETGGRPS